MTATYNRGTHLRCITRFRDFETISKNFGPDGRAGVSRDWSVFACGYDATSTLEVFFGERPAGLALEVLLKRDGLGLVSKCNRRFDTPREELQRVRNLA